MIKGLSTAGIWSEDIQKSLLPFYRDVVGLPVSVDTPEFVVFGTSQRGPSVTLGTHSEVHGKNTDPARHMVGLATDDIYADVARLKSKGVEFLEAEPEKFDNVSVATFKDPEGNYIQLAQFS